MMSETMQRTPSRSRGSGARGRFRFRSLTIPGILILFFSIHPVDCGAYEPDEARAIVLNRPTSVPPSSPGIVLASQRILVLSATGSATKEDHLFEVLGPARPAGPVRIRWTYRPEVERIKVIDALVHKRSGEVVSIPAESIRVEPCAAAGPKGYPGVADFVVSVPDPVTGDLVELHTSAEETPTLEPQYYVGEEHFAEGDSVVEAELRIRFPSVLSLLTMRIGDVPSAEEITHGTTYEGRWLLGHLSPAAPVHRGLVSHLIDSAPDTTGPPGILFGYRNDWQSVSAMRGYAWRRVLAETPAELADVAGRIQTSVKDPRARADSAIAWANRRLERVDIPAERLWYIPERLQVILERGGAIDRDRAAILVWLLTRMGIKADAAMVRHDSSLVTDIAFPQQLDVWVLRIRDSSGEERWFDLRDPAKSTDMTLPAGKALLWTVRRQEPALVPFPGTSH